MTLHNSHRLVLLHALLQRQANALIWLESNYMQMNSDKCKRISGKKGE